MDIANSISERKAETARAVAVAVVAAGLGGFGDQAEG
jgi:hypothetical protein